MTFFGCVWLVLEWCELRAGFCNWRLDRMREMDVLAEGFRNEPGKRLHDDLNTTPFKDSLRD